MYSKVKYLVGGGGVKLVSAKLFRHDTNTNKDVYSESLEDVQRRVLKNRCQEICVYIGAGIARVYKQNQVRNTNTTNS